jgi:trigger factor
VADVQVSLETGTGLERRMRVQVPAGRIEQEVEARLRSAGRTARLKGFRPGKVPAEVIRQRFGPQIRQDVLHDVVQSSYSEAIAQEKLRPAGLPRIEADPPASGQDFSYTAVFEVYPEFRVAGLDRLTIERPETPVADADVDRTQEQLRRQKGGWKSVERSAERGDRVIVDFNGTVKGEPVPGGTAEKLAIVIGDGRMLADFESNLIGLAAGGTRTFTIRFPSDYHDERLRSESVTFDVHVREVAAPDLPVLDEAFVKAFGVASGDLGEFRRLIRENLEREVTAKVRAETRRQLLEQLLAANRVDLPAVLVAREAAALQAEAMKNLGIKDVKDAPAVAAYEEIAQRRVRLGLIMNALIREHDLKVEPAEVARKLDEICRVYERPDDVKSLYRQNPELMAQVEGSVMEEQVMIWLAGRSQVTNKVVPFSELMGV